MPLFRKGNRFLTKAEQKQLRQSDKAMKKASRMARRDTKGYKDPKARERE